MPEPTTFVDPTAGDQADAVAPNQADPTPAADPAPTAPAPAGDAQRVEDLPDWAQKLVRDTRAEAAKYRTEKQTAAQSAEQALTDRLVTALGLKPDQATDPAALTQQLTAAQQAAKNSALQLAVFRHATKAGANADALLDSNTFLAKVNGLDHTSSDFPNLVGDAIKAAVDTNPNAFRIAQAAGASAADHAGGSGEPGPITESQLAEMSKKNPQQVAKWLEEGRLNHLL